MIRFTFAIAFGIASALWPDGRLALVPLAILSLVVAADRALASRYP
jgi:hypothetical protein